MIWVDKVKAGPCRQDVYLQTPVKPVSAEAPMSLQDLIIKRDAYTLDETSKQNLARHLQKFVKAVPKSSAESIFHEDQIELLTTINNEAKVRRLTKSLVLGKAKVMSYADLEEARAKRDEKESTQEAKGQAKRGRKRKSTTLEAPEPSKKMARISKAPKLAGAQVTQVSMTQDAEDAIEPEPSRAPVARMW